MISCDKGYVEVMEYPRAMQAVITYAQTAETKMIQLGNKQDALWYEIEDMEKSITEKLIMGKENHMHLDYTKDVMEIMTHIRKEWGMSYPEED